MSSHTQDDRHEVLEFIHTKFMEAYPDAQCELLFDNAFQLLVAVVLSAQCTDKMVNRVLPKLFGRYPSPEALSCADPHEVEGIIHSLGFFRAKARNIRSLSDILIKNYDGHVPEALEDLILLPGVGRKTANVVRSEWFKLPGLSVDTHFRRLSKRIGLTDEDDPTKIEMAFRSWVPENLWTPLSRCLIRHGREICSARRPACGSCCIQVVCRYGKEEKGVEVAGVEPAS